MDLGDPEPSREATPCRPLQAPPSLVRLGRRLSRWVPSARLPPPTIALCGGSPRRCPFAGREPEGLGRGVQATQSASSIAPGHGRGSVLVEFGGHSPRPVPAPTSSRGTSGTSPRWDHWVHNDRLLASGRQGESPLGFLCGGQSPRAAGMGVLLHRRLAERTPLFSAREAPGHRPSLLPQAERELVAGVM